VTSVTSQRPRPAECAGAVDGIEDIGAGVDGYAECLPKYYVVKRRLADLISALSAGTPIPTERSLAAEFRTSRTTVRKAVRELTLEGRLSSKRRQCTFVMGPKVILNLQLTSYTDDMRQHGYSPNSRLLTLGRVPADGEVARHLEIRGGAAVLRIERLRMANDEPMGIETTHLALARFPGLAQRMDSTTSLYTVLKRDYGVRLSAGKETIETIPAPPREAALLCTEVGCPMLLIIQTTRDLAGTPVEYSRSLYRGDRLQLVADLRPPVWPRRSGHNDDGRRLADCRDGRSGVAGEPQ
jgi:GntR family transcriptional regulator